MKSLLPFVAMIAILLVLNGSVTLGKAAMMGGLSPYVYLVYYDALGVVILLPWFVLHCLRGKRLPITFSLLGRFFGLSLIGLSLTSICLYTGLSYTSITVGAAIANLCPVFTYVFAICFRMERLDLRKSTDQIKAFGTFLAVLGAIVVTLYKGPALLEATHGHSNSVDKLLSEQSNWLLGCLFYTIGFLLRSLWSIFQADTAKLYPDEVTIVFFCNLFGTIQSAAVSFFLVKSRSAWKLHHKIEIIAIIYAAILLSVFKNTVTTWCLRKKGPVFVSMFDPLNVAMAVVLGFVFLADGVYLGSVVGSAAIIVGFYAVMWGQAKTTRAITNKIGGSESAYSSQVISPLLLNSHN